MNADDPNIVPTNWPIADMLPSEQSTIVIAGAWHGLYLHYLAQRFPDAKVIGFEPQLDAFLKIQERIATHDLKNAEVRNYGLGLSDKQTTMGNTGTDGASLYCPDPPFLNVDIQDTVPVLSELGLISLFVMNMEGYEYVLIPYLIGSKMIRRIQSLAIQFHPSFCPMDLRTALRQHYGEMVFDNYPTWTYWKCQP